MYQFFRQERLIAAATTTAPVVSPPLTQEKANLQRQIQRFQTAGKPLPPGFIQRWRRLFPGKSIPKPPEPAPVTTPPVSPAPAPAPEEPKISPRRPPAPPPLAPPVVSPPPEPPATQVTGRRGGTPPGLLRRR